MRNEILDAWSAAQALGNHLTTIEDFLRADDRLGALEAVREARSDLGRVALAMSEVWQTSTPRRPSWMTNTQDSTRPTNHEVGNQS